MGVGTVKHWTCNGRHFAIAHRQYTGTYTCITRETLIKHDPTTSITGKVARVKRNRIFSFYHTGVRSGCDKLTVTCRYIAGRIDSGRAISGSLSFTVADSDCT